ncbi:MAG: hypothetical protein PHN22_04755 [Candidatus ainarchaeum sp.]|nr:hypothetical protein [Candidatus ainarchaeum sp.]
MYDEKRKIDIKEKIIRITLQDIEIFISSSFKEDNLEDMIKKADILVNKYNIKSNNNNKNEIR